MRRAPEDPSGIAVAVLVASAYAVISIGRAWNGWAGGLDLGLFDQAVWHLSNGRAPEVSFVGGSIFADHVSPVLVVFAPLYWLRPSPTWLLLGQSIALGASVVPMRRLACAVGAPRWLATVATVGSAPLLAAAAFDFHPLALATPGVAWMLVGAIEGQRRIALLGLTWVFVCRADAAFVAVGVAVLATSALRRQLAVLGLGGAAVGLLVPHLIGDARQTFDRYYRDLGDSPLDAARHPWRIATAVADRSFWETLAIWLLPVLFVAILKPRWLAALLVGGAPLLLSSWPGVSLPWFHNAAAMAPVAIGGALAAVGSARADLRRPLGAALVAGCALALATQSPVSPRAPVAVKVPDVLGQNGSSLDQTLALVPADASVSAINQLAAPLAQRRWIYVFPCPFLELIAADDDAGLVDVCDGRSARPDIVLAEDTRRKGLEALGYDVTDAPTPGIVVGRWRR